VNYLTALARIRIQEGDVAAGRILAERCVTDLSAREPRDSETFYSLAAAETLFGRNETAVKFLRSAIDNGWVDHRWLTLDPRFDSLRNDPSFSGMLGELASRVRAITAEKSAEQLAAK